MRLKANNRFTNFAEFLKLYLPSMIFNKYYFFADVCWAKRWIYFSYSRRKLTIWEEVLVWQSIEEFRQNTMDIVVEIDVVRLANFGQNLHGTIMGIEIIRIEEKLTNSGTS
jgi:hypothetical protein